MTTGSDIDRSGFTVTGWVTGYAKNGKYLLSFSSASESDFS